MAHENLCRLCLKLSDQSTDLFQFKDGHLIADLVKIICPIEIEMNDSQLPSKVCNDCLELVIDAIHLRDLSLMNDQELRKNIKQSEERAMFIKTEEDDEIYIEALDEALMEPETVAIEYAVEVPKVIPKVTNSVHNIHCELCNQTFANASSFKRHQLRKHNNVEYRCDLCDCVFRTKHDIEQHMKRKHLIRYPNVKFQYSDKLTMDVTDMYEKLDEPQGLECSFCHFMNFDEDLLIEHLTSHQDIIDSGKMYCIHCPTPILTLEFMIEHTRSHNEKLKTHRCLICSKIFCFDEKFLIHLHNHKKNQHKICFCPQCGRKFSKMRLMEDHIRFIHNKESLYCCPECGQGFGSKSALNGHIKRHIEGSKYHCPFCPKSFSSHNLLNSHKVVHSTERPFGCTICDKRFKHQKVLSDHMKRHEGMQPVYICTVCDRGLNSVFALTRHQLTHTGSKPHQCEYCSKSYAQKNDLNKHMRSHVGDNTYFCDFPNCRESFRVMSELRIHQGVHYVKG